MITKMKKLTFLVYHKEYESFLDRIRQLGVVHVVERQRGEVDAALQALLQKRAQYKNVLLGMQRNFGDSKPDTIVRKDMTGDAMVARFEKFQADIQELKQQLPACEKDIASLEPWGEFSWKVVARLRDAGWFIQFYDCLENEYKTEWETDYNALVIRQHGGHVSFVTVTPHPIELDMEPLRLPQQSLSALMEKKTLLLEDIEDEEFNFIEFCRMYYRGMEYANRQLQGDIDLRKVQLDSEPMAEGSVVLLEGWIPEDVEPEVCRMLDESGVYYDLRPATKEDRAPIKLKNNAFARMFEVLTKMYGMPNYSEFDPTPIIAPFFSLFFAFCLGDAGYGLALIALGFILKAKLSKSLAGMMNMVITLGIVTTVFGAVLGTFFGVNLFEADLPQWMKEYMIAGKIDGTTYDKAMVLSLLIGVVNICLAMTVKAICNTVRYGFKETLSDWGWLLLVVGFICTGGLSFFEVISAQVTQWSFIIIGGVAAIGPAEQPAPQRLRQHRRGLVGHVQHGHGLGGRYAFIHPSLCFGLGGRYAGRCVQSVGLHDLRCGRTAYRLAALRTDTGLRPCAEHRHVLLERLCPSLASDVRGILQELRLRR